MRPCERGMKLCSRALARLKVSILMRIGISNRIPALVSHERLKLSTHTHTHTHLHTHTHTHTRTHTHSSRNLTVRLWL